MTNLCSFIMAIPLDQFLDIVSSLSTDPAWKPTVIWLEEYARGPFGQTLSREIACNFFGHLGISTLEHLEAVIARMPK